MGGETDNNPALELVEATLAGDGFEDSIPGVEVPALADLGDP